MEKLLGVSWCLPCLTIVKNSGGISPGAKSFHAGTVNDREKGIKNKLLDIQANGPIFTNIIPPCTTLLDTTFNASNTLLKLALLQKRNSSGKSVKMSESFSEYDNNPKGTNFAVALPNHFKTSKNPLNIPVDEMISHSAQIRDSFFNPSKMNKRSQSVIDIDSMVEKSSLKVEHYKSIGTARQDVISDKSVVHPLIKSTLPAEQKSTAIVRPCLRHRRSSYDDILGQSPNKPINSYSSLDNKSTNSKATFKTHSMLQSYDSDNSTQPLNKSVKFVLPETSERERRDQTLEHTKATNLIPNFSTDQKSSSSILPWTGFSALPYECLVNHPSNCYGTMCNSNLFPYTQYVPSIQKTPDQFDRQQSLNPLDASCPNINVSFTSASCDMNYVKSPLQFVSSNIANLSNVSAFGSHHESKFTKPIENNPPATLYWSTGCIYDPTVYVSSMSVPTNFCSTCCWNYSKDEIIPASYPEGTVLRDKVPCLSSSIGPFHDNSFKTGLKTISNVKYPLNEPDNIDDTESEDDSIEGDCRQM